MSGRRSQANLVVARSHGSSLLDFTYLIIPPVSDFIFLGQISLFSIARPSFFIVRPYSPGQISLIFIARPSFFIARLDFSWLLRFTL